MRCIHLGLRWFHIVLALALRGGHRMVVLLLGRRRSAYVEEATDVVDVA
jgi:hypothetical protein